MSAPEFTAIGIDIGGTKIAAGVVTFPDGAVRARRLVPTLPRRGGEATLVEVEYLISDLAAEATSNGWQIGAVGIGLCELVSPRGEILSANCIDWRHVPVRERLSAIAPVIFDADVRVAALAEASFGAGRPFHQFIYITLGTGIASCLVLDGKPFLGANGATGTMASSPISVLCECCGNTNRHTLEEFASGPALAARYNRLHSGGNTTGQEVLAAAAQGDNDAIFVIRSAAEALGSALGGLVNTLDPEAIIVGGGLGLSRGLYWDECVAATRRHIWSPIHRDLPILQAATGEDAGLVGAAAGAWRRLR